MSNDLREALELATVELLSTVAYYESRGATGAARAKQRAADACSAELVKLAANPPAEAGEPAKMLVDAEWLRGRNETDPDGMDTEAGSLSAAPTRPGSEEVRGVIRQALFEADEMTDRQMQGKHLNQSDAERMRNFTRILAKACTEALSRTQPDEGWRPMDSAALSDISAERKRQIEVEGWPSEHDDEHNADGSLARAASCYALNAGRAPQISAPLDGVPWAWPWWVTFWKPKAPRQDLVRAGALIVAEIERLDRAPPPPTISGKGGEP